MLPNYIARISFFATLSKFKFLILLFWIIAPISIIVIDFIILKGMKPELIDFIILAIPLLIPAVPVIIHTIIIKCMRIEFYDNKYVFKEGVLDVEEETRILVNVYGVTVKQTLLGRIFKYGSVYINCPGTESDLTFFRFNNYIKNPKALKRYLDSRVNPKAVAGIIHN